jgi:hypothetical protein
MRDDRDEFGLTKADRDEQARRRMVLAMGKNLPKMGEDRLQKLLARLRALLQRKRG